MLDSTKQNVVNSLLTLLDEKPMDDITISELTQMAGISRMTFYRNYSCKEDILSEHFKDVLKQIQPEEMIVLTFTNKAADEIKERLIAKEKFLKKEKNDEEPRLDGFGTFHSVALWMLREKLEVEKAGWSKVDCGNCVAISTS